MSNQTRNQRGPKQDRGFTLIEVLVALLVLSIGLLGLAALQTTSLQLNTSSYQRTQATLLAYDIIDRMRANTTGFSNGNYHTPDATAAASKKAAYTGCKDSGCACNSTTTTCNTSNIALYDLGKWYERAEKALGASALAPTISQSSSQAIITIYWTEQDIQKSQRWEVQL